MRATGEGQQMGFDCEHREMYIWVMLFYVRNAQTIQNTMCTSKQREKNVRNVWCCSNVYNGWIVVNSKYIITQLYIWIYEFRKHSMKLEQRTGKDRERERYIPTLNGKDTSRINNKYSFGMIGPSKKGFSSFLWTNILLICGHSCWLFQSNARCYCLIKFSVFSKFSSNYRNCNRVMYQAGCTGQAERKQLFRFFTKYSFFISSASDSAHGNLEWIMTFCGIVNKNILRERLKKLRS